MEINHFLSSLPKPEELLKVYKLSANKQLGQNFLLDLSITDKIVSCAGNITQKNILEIGPGVGTLTRSILYKKPKNLYCVEYDIRFKPILQIFEPYAQVFYEDAVKFNESQLTDKLTIIANLPYNIATLLLLKWYYDINRYDSIIVMLQKEVAERLVAQVGTSDYGRLSIITSTLVDAEIVLSVGKENFYPSPKVDSLVVRLVPKGVSIDLDLLTQVTRVAFSQARKKIKTSLKSLLNEKMLIQLNIDPQKRAAELSVEEYHAIVKFLKI